MFLKKLKKLKTLTILKKTFHRTNALQIILCVILFHSLASIMIIYLHLMWFFSEEKLWKEYDSGIQLKQRFVVWNIHSAMNVIASRVIPSDEISVFGWWMDHVKYETDIHCFNQRWALCSKGYSTTCKADGLRAIYQYLTFSKESYVSGFDLSVTATADQLESQVIGASFGILAAVKLHNGRTENIQIQFPSNIEPLTTQSTSFSASDSSVYSITLMLLCYGYSGSVHFTDPVLIPHKNFAYPAAMLCPFQQPNIPLQREVLKLEHLQKPLNMNFKDQPYLVTLVTQVSMERLSALERSLRLWSGPVSLVIYVTSKHSEYEWQRLYIKKKLKTLKLSDTSCVSLALGSTTDDDYPINALRNIAIRQVKTSYMFLLDGDFQPSPNFQQKFFNSAKLFESNSNVAFIVPAFEYIELPQKGDNAPQTKEELLQLLHREEPFILPFRILESSESHRTTDYWKWYRADKPYSIKIFSDKYEPYIVLQQRNPVPLYDERFYGYGMNKVTHITELFAANFSFIVLPDVWVLHLPHKISSYAVEFLQNASSKISSINNRGRKEKLFARSLHQMLVLDNENAQIAVEINFSDHAIFYSHIVIDFRFVYKLYEKNLNKKNIYVYQKKTLIEI